MGHMGYVWQWGLPYLKKHKKEWNKWEHKGMEGSLFLGTRPI